MLCFLRLSMRYKIDFDIELLRNKTKGVYIALEGIDGSGKTTQAEALAAYFTKLGRKVVVTQEPRRDGVIGKIIHKVLRHEVKVPPVALQYLFSADRAVHQEKLIMPSLKEGKVVISDRAFWSGVAYGLLDRAMDRDSKKDERLLVSLSILSMYHQFVAPDYSFYLRTDVKTAIKRLKGEGRPLEYYENEKKLERVKKIYDWLDDKYSDALIKINGERQIEEVTGEIVAHINK